jgi:hypothetical protein
VSQETNAAIAVPPATGGYWMTAPNARKTGSSVGDHGYRLRRVRDNGSQLAEYA